MKKKFKNVLALVITTSILLAQATVFAVPLADSFEKNPVPGAIIVAEDVSKRGEFEKHYLCSDGTFVAVSYAEAIHYKNEMGEWIDVDNVVTYDAKTQNYRTGNQAFEVEFASTLDVSELVTLRSGEHVISWGITTDKTVSLQEPIFSDIVAMRINEPQMPSVTLKNAEKTGENKTYRITDSEAFELEKMSGGIAYENIITGSPEITVDYSVYHNKIEEDIYINSKTDAKSISMNLSVGALVARVNFDNSVSFLDDEGEPAYTIGVPYMEDAAGEILNDIKVTVTQSGSNCVVTYTPNEQWLNSDERVYPILLDPSITTREYSANIVDTYVYEGNTANHSSEQKNYVGIRNSKINRTFIKITNLPAIDQSMPVIGATLTLTLPSPTASGHRVALYKLSSDWNPSTVTYANQPSFSESGKIGTCDFNSSTKKYVFDLTADMARMYNEFLAGVNYGYVLKYDNESKTDPDYNSTYSMERTTVADRPLLTITYGYSLPTGLSNGGVYALQNRGSYGYLTVHGGTDADNVNVYLKSTMSTDIAANQQFKLEYVSATGAYRLRPMHSSSGSGRVLDIVKSGSYVANGGNVQMTTLSGSISNEWFIVGTGFNYFKIIPRTNMSLSLTACSGLDGTAEGTTSTSQGNVFVATTVENSDFQQWRMIDMSTGKSVSGGGNSDIVPNGTYYFNNRGTCRYLTKSVSVSYVDGLSGLISDLENRIRWTLTCVFDGMYTMRSADDPTQFVVPSDVGTRIVLDTLPSDTDIPDEYLWKITAASGGGVKIQNVATGEYLYSLGATNHLNSTLPSTSSMSYDKYVWRMANVDLYGNTSEHSYREMTSGFKINDIRVDVNQEKRISPQNNYTDVLWTSYNDFTYNFTSTNFVCGEDGFIGTSRGPAVQVTATHKVTGYSTTFNVVVNSNITTFSEMLGQLYDAAYEYAHLSRNRTLELTFNFIAAQKYYKSFWPGVIGDWNEAFGNYVYNEYPNIYSYFICDPDEEKLSDEDYIIMLPDPDGTGSIDAIHMCATLNRLYYSGDTTFHGIDTGDILDEEVDALCGWAGDFQSLIRDYFKYTSTTTQDTTSEVYAAFYPMIGNASYYCSYNDIISDMDSCHLYEIISSTATVFNGDDLENAVRSYYFGESGNISSKRFTNWIGEMTRTQLYNKITDYCNDHSPYFIKWPILDDYSIYGYQQEAFTEAFVDYLLIQKSNE